MEQRSASDSVSFLYPENAAITENQELSPVNQQEILDNLCLQLGYPPYFGRFDYWHSVIGACLGGLFWTIPGALLLETFLSGAVRMLNSGTDIPRVLALILCILAAVLILYSGMTYFRYLLRLLKPYRQTTFKRYKEILLKGHPASGQILSVEDVQDSKFRNSPFKYRGRYSISFKYGDHAINASYLTWQNVEKGQHVHVLHHEGLSVLL